MNESEDRIKPKIRKVHDTKEISATSQKARFKVLTLMNASFTRKAKIFDYGKKKRTGIWKRRQMEGHFISEFPKK